MEWSSSDLCNANPTKCFPLRQPPDPSRLTHVNHQVHTKEKLLNKSFPSCAAKELKEAFHLLFLMYAASLCNMSAVPAAKRQDSPQCRSALSQRSRRRCPADLSRVSGEESRRGGEFQNTGAAGSSLYLGKSNGTVCYKKKNNNNEKNKHLEESGTMTELSARVSQSSSSNDIIH